MNASYGRLTAAAIAVITIAGLCGLRFGQKKAGFVIMCAGSVLSFLSAVISSTASGISLMAAVGMSLVGAALVPVITALFIRRDWKTLK